MKILENDRLQAVRDLYLSGVTNRHLIARKTGLKPKTVSNYLVALKNNGWNVHLARQEMSIASARSTRRSKGYFYSVVRGYEPNFTS